MAAFELNPDAWDASGWEHEGEGSDFMQGTWHSHSREDDDVGLLRTKAEEACDEAGMANTLRAIHQLECAALIIQITWRGYRAEKRAKRDKIMKQKEQEFLRRQRCRNQDADLMNWIDTLNITVYPSASSSSFNVAAQDEENKSWKSPGIVARAFSVYRRMDWTDRREGIRMAGKYMQLRGWWTAGKDGYLGDEEVERLVKLESGWKAAGIGRSQRFEYMYSGTDDPGEGAKNGGMWHGATTASRGFEYFPAKTSNKEAPSPVAAAALQNRDGGIASNGYGNAEEAKIAAYRHPGRRDNDGEVRTHEPIQSPRPIKHFQNPAAGRANHTFHPLLPGDGVASNKNCEQGISLRWNIDASDLAQSCSFYNSPGHHGTETEAGSLQLPPVHVMEDRLWQKHPSGLASSGPSSEERPRASHRSPRRPPGENRGRSVSPRKSRIKTAPDRRRGKKINYGQLESSNATKADKTIERQLLSPFMQSQPAPDDTSLLEEDHPSLNLQRSRARTQQGEYMKPTLSSSSKTPKRSGDKSISFFAGRRAQPMPEDDQAHTGVCSFADPMQPPKPEPRIFRHPIIGRKKQGDGQHGVRLPPVKHKSMTHLDMH